MHTLRASLLAGAALAVVGTAARAQDAGPEAQAGTVEEVVVTARRTAESLQETPLSVSAFSERALERIGARDTTDLQGAVPNLNIVQGRGSSNATNIYIRGVGQPDALQTFDPAVGVYVDDVYYSRIRGTQFELFDIERIEVLRGPQGTLYGKNTIGGALKVVTRKPDQDLRANASATVGSYGQAEFRVGLSGPVTDTVAAGFALLGAARDGYVHDPVKGAGVDYNDKNTKAVRGQIAWTPAERLRVDLSADYSKDDAALNVGQSTSTLVTAFPAAPPLLALPANPPEYDFLTTTSPGLPNSTRLEASGVSANVSYALSDALTLKSITAYRKLLTDDYIDIDATALRLGDVLVAVDQDQVSQELQLLYDADPLQLVAGVFYLKEDVGSHQEAYADDFVRPFSFLRTIDDDLETTSHAAFVNASYAVTDALRVSAGIRYTEEEKAYRRSTSTFSNLAALRGTFAFRNKETFDDVSPMASVDYRLNDDVLLYARVAKGFKSGGFNGRANSPGEENPYDAETAVSYEAGVKSDLLDDRFRLNVAAFSTDYKDFQARVGRSVTSPAQPIPAIDFAVLNAGKLEIRGAELEATATPADGLLLDAQIGYLDAEYDEFFEQRLIGGVLTPIDRSFQEPAFSPELTARFAGQYEFDLAERGFLTVGAAARFRSEHALAVDNSDLFTRARFPGMFQDDYWLYDARLAWESPDRRFTVTLLGRNLSDEVYRTDAQEFSSVGGIRTAYYGAPSTVSLTVTGRY